MTDALWSCVQPARRWTASRVPRRRQKLGLTQRPSPRVPHHPHPHKPCWKCAAVKDPDVSAAAALGSNQMSYERGITGSERQLVGIEAASTVWSRGTCSLLCCGPCCNEVYAQAILLC